MLYESYNGLFIFGSEIFREIKHDAISSLPIEMSWKIFSYLDSKTLKLATLTCTMWKRIILSNKRLRRRLNHFQLDIKLGSSLARYYRRNRRKWKKKGRNYLPVEEAVQSTKTVISSRKRGGEELVVCVKRYKLH